MTRAVQFTLFLLLTLSPDAVQIAHAEAADGSDGHELGVRTAAGRGVNAAEFVIRWPAHFLQEHVLEPYLPEGGTAHW
jgi:hypothetical protein